MFIPEIWVWAFLFLMSGSVVLGLPRKTIRAVHTLFVQISDDGVAELHVLLKEVFWNKIVLNISVPSGGMQEFGRSQKTPANTAYTLDLAEKDWYAYNDNFGTSEEKALVKYIDAIMPRLEEKYDDIYLVRNEKCVRIFSFDEGRPFEPDYLLFLRHRISNERYDNILLFIEPKGEQLMKADKWKEQFLKQIKQMGDVRWMTSCDHYNVWGLPFYNEKREANFDKEFTEDVL